MADDPDPVALAQRTDDVGVDADATHRFDLGAGDRLSVGDQGERLEQRA
jgi:hypothetical protein